MAKSYRQRSASSASSRQRTGSTSAERRSDAASASTAGRRSDAAGTGASVSGRRSDAAGAGAAGRRSDAAGASVSTTGRRSDAAGTGASAAGRRSDAAAAGVRGRRSDAATATRKKSGDTKKSKKSQPERSHVRSPNQVHPRTPKVLDSPSDAPYIEDESSVGSRRSASSLGRTRNSAGSRNTSGYRRRNAATGARKKRGLGLVPKLAIVFGIVLLLFGGAISLYYSNLFPLTNITVAGNVKLQSGYVTSLAAVPEGSTFFRTDREAIRARLLTEPWILDASVERGFPDTLVLRITEQPVAAVVSIVPETANDSVEQWIIAEDGTWIALVEEDVVGHARINPEELVRLVKIKDVSAVVRPVAGVKETDAGIINALTMLNNFSKEMRDMVAVISAPDAVQTTMTLYNNVRVAFGAAVDITAKERAIASLLAEYEGTITYINVRVADRPTHRTV